MGHFAGRPARLAPMDDAEQIISLLGLSPHPEGGHYAETWREAAQGQERGAGTAIYFLLRAGEESRWHRIDATEIWHFYAGSPLLLQVAYEGQRRELVLGTELHTGQRPQLEVPPGAWQAARSLGEFTLVGCTVSPAFDFAHFEMAEPGWEPT